MVMDLLVTGKTKVSNKEYQDRIIKLAECLQINMRNLLLDLREGPGAPVEKIKIRLRNMSEILIPGFNFNNNFKKTKASDDEQFLETEDNFDGVLEKEQYDGSDLIDNDDHHEQTQEDTDCKMCNQSPCLSGLFLTESIKDPVGLRVKATGNSWAASKFQGKTGTVVSFKHTKVNNFLNILWEHKKAKSYVQQQFTYLAKGKPKFTI